MFTTILYLITISFSYSYRDLQKSRPPTQKKDLRSPPQVLSFSCLPCSSHPLFVLSPVCPIPRSPHPLFVPSSVCPIPFRPIPFRPIPCSSHPLFVLSPFVPSPCSSRRDFQTEAQKPASRMESIDRHIRKNRHVSFWQVKLEDDA